MMATSVDSERSISITICLAWKALLSSASFQLIAPDGIRHTVIAALLLDIVVATDREQRSLGELLPLRLDNVADIDQLVVPGVQRNDLGRSVLEDVGDDAAGHRRDDLLTHRRVGRD